MLRDAHGKGQHGHLPHLDGTASKKLWRVARQGKASFGDAGVFVEKYVERARHIEVQIFGDGEGSIVTLPGA